MQARPRQPVRPPTPTKRSRIKLKCSFINTLRIAVLLMVMTQIVIMLITCTESANTYTLAKHYSWPVLLVSLIIFLAALFTGGHNIPVTLASLFGNFESELIWSFIFAIVAVVQIILTLIQQAYSAVIASCVVFLLWIVIFFTRYVKLRESKIKAEAPTEVQVAPEGGVTSKTKSPTPTTGTDKSRSSSRKIRSSDMRTARSLRSKKGGRSRSSR